MDPITVQLLVAVLSGGAAFKFVEKIFELLFHSGKSLRDELREEIERLEGNIDDLNTRVGSLQAEVETWKNKVDEWRNRYYELLEQHQFLKLADKAKDQIIEALQRELDLLRGKSSGQ